jgi:hypothetical protein
MNAGVLADGEPVIELCAFLEIAREVSDIRVSKYLCMCYKHLNYILITHCTSVQFLLKLIRIYSGSSA